MSDDKLRGPVTAATTPSEPVIPPLDLRLEFKLEPNEDMTLTCIICGFNRCSLCFMVRSRRAGKRSWYGVHKECHLDRWLDRWLDNG